MRTYKEMSQSELSEQLKAERARYEAFKNQKLSLDMTRGKPNAAQLDLSMKMLNFTGYKAENGFDCRNYGVLDGIPEAKRFFADILKVSHNEIIVGGNSSLSLMHDCVVNALLMGVSEESTPWVKQGSLKFLCPVPGYDRHFAITEKFGFEMIPIPMDENGPDMELVKSLAENDASVKGIWCVPKYSNPSGITYSEDVVRKFAALKPAADDFRIFWDNAYAVHDLTETPDVLYNIFDACKEQGSEDMVYEFTSTSKISFSGAGVACIAASEKNCKYLCKQLGIQTIGHDKLNQLRHVAYLRDATGVAEQMKKHAAIVAPKFAAVDEILEKELGNKDVATWTKPHGGYFISFEAKGCAKRITELALNAGLSITPAGSTYPYGRDEADSNLRIAPTLPSVDDLKVATELFCVCVKVAILEKLLSL